MSRSQPRADPAALPATVPLAAMPFLLLGLLTIATLADPLVLFLVLRGGVRRGWPPDRAIEWWSFVVGITAYVLLLAACLLNGFLRWRRTIAGASAARLQAEARAGIPGAGR